MMDIQFFMSSQVADALESRQPMVALESTLITHGLPYPTNVETAVAMETAVRASGALPVTIGILQGRITVGLSGEQIEYLAQRPAGTVRKCSRRDLPIVVAKAEDGATTVSATMIIAHRVGISIFATGGIGGVHRGQPFDVSTDLTELGRTPICVVCSGAKSILDLPLTLEYLETQGVPVIGYQTDTLPAFYSRSSGLPLQYRVDSPQEAAQIIEAGRQLRLNNGMLVTVPVPQADALSDVDAEAAIRRASAEAAAAGIHGAAVTPYLLARVAELTEGASRRANTSLLLNNAAVAGEIAVALKQVS